MTKTKTKHPAGRRRDRKTTGPKVVREYDVVLFPIVDGEAFPDAPLEPVHVWLTYKPGEEPADRAGLKAQGEALGRAIRLTTKGTTFGPEVDFDALAITPTRETLKS